MPVNVIADRVLETSTTTGTGDITLAGAVTGYQTFAAGVSGGGSCYYMIEAVDVNGLPTGDWEVGIGTFDGVVTLARTTPLNGSASTPVDFAAGTKRVYLTALAQQLGPMYATVTKATNLTGQDFTSITAIGWDTEFGGVASDASDLHNNVTNNSRFTIPAGWPAAAVRLSAQVGLLNILADQWVQLSMKMNNTGPFISVATFETGSTSPAYQLITPEIWCVAGDYFELSILVESDTAVDIDSTRSWFRIEVLQ